MDKIVISISTLVDAPLETVWQKWTNPTDIVQWNHASEDWHTTKAENDLRVGGKFLSRMEAKDGSFGFDFIGIYNQIIENELIAYSLEDDRKVNIQFSKTDKGIQVTEIFEAETENAPELQEAGWQCILNNFKKYVETK